MKQKEEIRFNPPTLLNNILNLILHRSLSLQTFFWQSVSQHGSTYSKKQTSGYLVMSFEMEIIWLMQGKTRELRCSYDPK